MKSRSRAKPARRTRLRVGLLGLGRAGRAFRNSLRAAGHSVIRLRRGARPPAAALDLIVLAVPDDAIAAESRRLARAGAACGIAMHLSGALDSSALSALAKTGAGAVSFHPLRSFSGKPGETFAGCLVAIEGDPPSAREAQRLARELHATPWRVTAEAKPLYHAAATLAAGGTAALIGAASQAASAAGLPEAQAFREFAALAVSAAENVRRLGFPAGATGPLARGDRTTLRLHRRALATRPLLRRLYLELARAYKELIGVDRHSGRH
jgi:predicted short-subunit dehydrogenase-like oxidoreductase (DUF2520 family)